MIKKTNVVTVTSFLLCLAFSMSCEQKPQPIKSENEVFQMGDLTLGEDISENPMCLNTEASDSGKYECFLVEPAILILGYLPINLTLNYDFKKKLSGATAIFYAINKEHYDGFVERLESTYESIAEIYTNEYDTRIIIKNNDPAVSMDIRFLKDCIDYDFDHKRKPRVFRDCTGRGGGNFSDGIFVQISSVVN